MNPTFLPVNSFDSYSFDASEDDPNGYISGLLSQQSSASSAPATHNGFFDDLFTPNGDLTGSETSFGSDLLPDLTWDDYRLITEDLLPDGALCFDTPAGIAPGVPNITTSGAPSTFTFGARSGGISMPVGFPTVNPAGNTGINVSGSPPMPNLAAGKTGISMPGALPPFDFTAGSTNASMPVGRKMFDLPAEITGIDVPVGLQTTIEYPSYVGFGNRGFSNVTNGERFKLNGGWDGTSQQVRQPIIGVHAHLALPTTHSKISSSSEPRSKSPNSPPAPPTTPQQQQSPAAMSNTYSKNSSNTSSPPKRSRSSSPQARRPPKRRKDWREGSEATFRIVHDERSMPTNFQANPDNHGRFQYLATGRRQYLNGPGAVQERRRRREGNLGANQQGQGNRGK